MKFKAICENHLYSKAYSKGKRAVTSALAVYVLPDYAARRLAKQHPQHIVVNRIGLTATKTLGGAVVRTRCRRILREGLRSVTKERPLKTGFLIVIAARKAAVPLKSMDIAEQLRYAFGKLDMFAKDEQRTHGATAEAKDNNKDMPSAPKQQAAETVDATDKAAKA